MKISYNWLKEFVSFDYTPAQLADVLTLLGLETASFEEIGGIPGDLQGVVVGHVLSVVKHPNADRLRVCQVDTGEAEPVQIVCGAANVAEGQKVAVATPGTTLYPFGKGKEGAFTIQKSKIRGEVSLGMICAADEVGLSEDHEGIMVLDPALPVGTPFIQTLTLNKDVILEVDLTPNRVDAASHYGVARDIAAFLRTRARLPEIKDGIEDATLSNPVSVRIADPDRCKRYSSIYIEGVTVAESPDWLKARIQSIGLRPISNIVDITNMVLHELGQPMHAFDADKLEGQQIIVGTLSEAAPFTTLDGVSRTLTAGEDLMINDASKPLCVAGVMGGLNSGVTEETTRIFLESAYFDPVSVRRTARRLGLSTDSSFRYERGADPHMTRMAALRAASLIVEVAGGRASILSDQTTAEFPHFPVTFSVAKAQRLIGKPIPKAEMVSILQALEMEVNEDADGDTLHLRVPPYRVDVQRDIDVLEDLLRVYGHNQVELPSHLSYTLPFRQYKDLFRLKEHVANLLSANGYYEVLNNSLNARSLGDEDAVTILNPLSEDLAVMRQSMLPGLLETLRYNQNRGQESMAVYEFGKTYRKGKSGFEETEWLALAVSGKRSPMHWDIKPSPTGLWTLTKEVERLQTWIGFEGELRETDAPEFDYGLELRANGQQVLRYGRVRTEQMSAYDLRSDAFVMLIDWQKLAQLHELSSPQYKAIPQYPGQRRDVSMLLGEERSFGEIRRVLPPLAPELIRSVELHDVYRGKNIPEGRKSYLVSVELRDEQTTLDDKRADAVMERIYKTLETQLGAEIRR